MKPKSIMAILVIFLLVGSMASLYYLNGMNPIARNNFLLPNVSGVGLWDSTWDDHVISLINDYSDTVVNGTDGADGVNGSNGSNGSDGAPGVNGNNGLMTCTYLIDTFTNATNTYYQAIRGNDSYVSWTSTNCSYVFIQSLNLGSQINNDLPCYLKFASGSFVLENSTDVWSNKKVEGSGIGVTTIYGAWSIGNHSIINIGDFAWAHTVKNTTISDMTINGINDYNVGINTYQRGLTGNNIINCVFKDLFITNTPKSGLGIDGAAGCIVDRVYVENAGNNGIGIGTGGLVEAYNGNYDGEPIIISNCIVRNISNNGFTFEISAGSTPSTGGLMVSGCQAYHCKDGFTVTGSQNVTLLNCQTYSNSQNGFYFSYWNQAVSHGNASNVILDGFISRDNYLYGILIDTNSTDISISNGLTINNARGIVSTTANRISIDHITAHDNLMDGIRLYSTGNSSVTNSMLYNNGKNVTIGYQTGIHLDGISFYNTIVGNTIFDDQGTKTQKVGLKFENAGNQTFVSSNNIYGNSVYDIQLQDAATGGVIITNNRYTVLTDSGQGTIIHNNVVNGVWTP